MAPPRLYERPLDQLTRLMHEARARGVPFDQAWDEALRPGRTIVMTNAKDPPVTALRWPTDRTDRVAWMAAIAATKEGWRRAYEQLPVSEAERGLHALADGLTDERKLLRLLGGGGIGRGQRVASAA